MSVLLFDIGGTSMRMATGAEGAVADIYKIPTPRRPEDAIIALGAYQAQYLPTCEGAYGGIAGVMVDGVVRTAPHLPEWNGFAFASSLADAVSASVYVRNDAELAGLGEAVYGAGKEYALVAYIGIGTGVGGANIQDKHIASHALGFEPGHQVLDVNTGASFEELVSGSALEERFRKHPLEIPRSVYDEMTPVLAAGLYNVLLTWSPDVLVLGGSLMNEENGYRIGDIEQSLAALPSPLPTLPHIVHAKLGDASGLYGALALSAQQ